MTRTLMLLLLAGVVMFGSRGTVFAISEIEMAAVKGGCFQMGDIFGDGEPDEKPVHEVCVNDFYIGKYKVTQGQWKALMGNNPSYCSDCGDNCPVEGISWYEVQEFIAKLNKKTGKKYRLSTEAEWEYAARSGGHKEKWSGTSDSRSLGKYAWFSDNGGSTSHKVGLKKPNGLGLYDMSGNVWEWVNDWYSESYYAKGPSKNPQGPPKGEKRVVRGGCYHFAATDVRTVVRTSLSPSNNSSMAGFRLALSH